MSEIQDEAYDELCRENERLEFRLIEERKTIEDLSELCFRAAEALEYHNFDHLEDDLIAKLRKVAG